MEARQYPRTSIPGMEGTLFDDEDGWSPILNISKGGMLLQVGGSKEPEVGSVRRIRIKLLGKEIPVAVDGKVLRKQNGCVAIKFENTIDLSAAMAK